MRRIGQHFNADGLLLVSGLRVTDRDWRFMLTLLTASLAWPTLMAQEKVEATADLFEVSSGRIVWRSHISKSAAEPTPHGIVIGLLLKDLETALPEVLVESLCNLSCTRRSISLLFSNYEGLVVLSPGHPLDQRGNSEPGVWMRKT